MSKAPSAAAWRTKSVEYQPTGCDGSFAPARTTTDNLNREAAVKTCISSTSSFVSVRSIERYVIRKHFDRLADADSHRAVRCARSHGPGRESRLLRGNPLPCPGPRDFWAHAPLRRRVLKLREHLVLLGEVARDAAHNLPCEGRRGEGRRRRVGSTAYWAEGAPGRAGPRTRRCCGGRRGARRPRLCSTTDTWRTA